MTTDLPEETLPEFPEEGAEDNPLFEDVDPATIVTIRPGAGEPRYVVVAEPTPFSDLLQRAGLTFNGQINMFVEGSEIQYQDLVQGGQTVTVIGNVKGG